MIERMIVRPEAEAEMAEAFEWYENRVSGLGFEFLSCIEAAISAIRRSPRQFPLVHRSARRALIRRFPYEIFYVEDDNSVVVLAVFHAKRDPKNWRNRL